MSSAAREFRYVPASSGCFCTTSRGPTASSLASCGLPRALRKTLLDDPDRSECPGKAYKDNTGDAACALPLTTLSSGEGGVIV
jgi:hypothetical protein